MRRGFRFPAHGHDLTVTPDAQQERRLEASLEASLCPHVVLDAVRDGSGALADLRVVGVNDAAAAYLGKDPADLMGGTVREALATSLEVATWPDLAAAMDTDGPTEVTMTLGPTPTGGARMIERRLARVGDSLAMSWRDVTEEAMTLAQYRLMVDNSADVVFHTSAGLVRWISPSCQEVLGWPQDELIGRETVQYWHPDDLDAAVRLRDATYSGGVGKGTFRWRRSSGDYVWLEAVLRPVTEADGTLGAVGVMRDVSERVAAEAAAERERAHLRAVIDSEVEPHITLVAIRDANGTIVDFEYADANQAALDYLGTTAEEFAGSTLTHRYSSEDAGVVRDLYARTVDTGEPLVADDYRFPSPSFGGQIRWYDLRGARLGDGLSLAWRDVTERHEAVERLARSEHRYRLLAENVADVIATGTNEGVIDWVSDSVVAMTGWTPQEWHGRQFMDFIHPDDRSSLASARKRVLEGQTARLEARTLTHSGEWRWVAIRLRPVVDAQGDVAGRVIAWQDINDRVVAEQALDRALGQDRLTGLATRATFIERLATRAEGAEGPVSVLCVGVDELSAINEAYGHALGDLALTMVARRLVELVGDPVRIGRGASSDFLVVVWGGSDDPEVDDVAERIRETAAQELRLAVHRAHLTVSIGVASSDRDGSPEHLVQVATMAMREAKAAGRNRIVFADPRHATAARERMALTLDVRDGLTAGEFVPWLMPIAALATGATVGYEALARWERPDGQVSAPGQFLDAADRAGLVHVLDAAIFAQAVHALRALAAPAYISVNASPRSLREPDFADAALRLIEAAGQDPGRVHLEVTETALLDVGMDTVAQLRRLADAGVRIYVDDFGTGYSSISHLRDLPVAGLKLHQSFTEGVAQGEPTSTRLAQALAGLSAGLGLDTIAEGVEAEAAAAVLAAQGWRHGQGWLYGRAVPIAEVVGSAG